MPLFSRLIFVFAVLASTVFALTPDEEQKIREGRWSYELVEKVIAQKQARHYAAAFTYSLGNNDFKGTNAGTVAEAFRTLLATDAPLRAAVRAHYVKPNKETKASELVVAVGEIPMGYGAALQAAGELKEVNTVVYNGVPKPLGVGAEGKRQLNHAEFADWILDGRHTELYSNLMALREKMGPATKPTKADFTNKMLKAMESEPTPNAGKLMAAIEAHMVVNIKPITEEGRVDKNGKEIGYKMKTLQVNLSDGSDLVLANKLKAAGKLDAVEIVRYPGLQDRHIKDGVLWTTTNYMGDSLVLDRDGNRLAELIDPRNFGPRPDIGRNYGSPGLWRNEFLRNAADAGFGKDPATCPFRRLAPNPMVGLPKPNVAAPLAAPK